MFEASAEASRHPMPAAGRICWRRPAPTRSFRAVAGPPPGAVPIGRGRAGRGRHRAARPGPADAERLDRHRRSSRSPAVSESSTGHPPNAVRRETTSRVTPGCGVDDRPLEAGQGVEQSALAHIRPAGDDDLPAAEEPGADLGRSDQDVESASRGSVGPAVRAGPRRSAAPAIGSKRRGPGRAGSPRPSAWEPRRGPPTPRRGSDPRSSERRRGSRSAGDGPGVLAVLGRPRRRRPIPP